MEKIRYIFQHALYISTEEENPKLQDHLGIVDLEFRSVACEGIAMGLAVKDFADGTLQRWRELMRVTATEYLPHIHVGLGWAVAKKKLPSLVFLNSIKPLLYAKVFDGHGYYDGTFKQVPSIVNKLRPDYIQQKDFSAYDQGLGRSLWYNHKGDIDKIKEVIDSRGRARRAAPPLRRGSTPACSPP
jgi:hypothetical protein